MKVLLVDDEPLTTESLERYVDWQTLGIREVRSASNGCEALDILPGYCPDIIVSDVRMPRMNGIEFASHARELFPRIKIIFLSGYSDKEYLKSAIHLKALSYVEKPVKLDELTASLRESVAQCEAEAASRTLTRSVIRHRILGKLTKEARSVDELRKEYPDYAPDFFSAAARCMALRLSVPASRQLRLDDTMRESIESLFAASLGDSERAAFYGYSDDDLLFCLMDAETISSSDFKQIARELLYSLNLHCGDKLAFAIGIGRESSPSVPLHEACLSALAAVQSQFYFGAGLVFSEPPPTVRFDASSAAANVCPDFHQALRDENEAEIEALIDRLTLEARTLRDPETDRVRNAYFRLLMILHEFAMEKKLTVIDPSQEESFIWQEVGELCTLDALRDYVVGNVQAVFSQYKESTAVNARVGGVMHYIKIHYADKDLTTKSIADNTYLSQSYMCALFKKETGKTVNEYMTEVRLEKAKELLKERHVKLYEIASAIGITDPNYFSSMFKRATGLTPSQYRERM